MGKGKEGNGNGHCPRIRRISLLQLLQAFEWVEGSGIF
jgi:hypothetical protein